MIMFTHAYYPLSSAFNNLNKIILDNQLLLLGVDCDVKQRFLARVLDSDPRWLVDRVHGEAIQAEDLGGIGLVGLAKVLPGVHRKRGLNTIPVEPCAC